MLQEDRVREILSRLERGEGVKSIARTLGVDRKTIKRWRQLGGWRPRVRGARRRGLDAFGAFLEKRGPEVAWNGAVLLREVQGLGFTGGYLQVQRFVRPLRDAKRWAAVATVRFETEPGRQAQVDYGQLRVWIAEQVEREYTCSCSRSATRAGSSCRPTAMKNWTRSSMVTSKPSATSAAFRLRVS